MYDIGIDTSAVVQLNAAIHKADYGLAVDSPGNTVYDSVY